mgnify:CR=1 FL=1
MENVAVYYQQTGAVGTLAEGLKNLCQPLPGQPVFICVGTPRHILDCLGPLTGTMLKEIAPRAAIYGTLDEPLHGRNLASFLHGIRLQHPGSLEIAVDASLGNRGQLGLVKGRLGPLLPGRALAKRLPEVGDVSLTGVVGIRGNRLHPAPEMDLSYIYHMARLLSEALSLWYETREK